MLRGGVRRGGGTPPKHAGKALVAQLLVAVSSPGRDTHSPSVRRVRALLMRLWLR